MRISAIPHLIQAIPAFKGRWEERQVGSWYSGQYITEKTYVPDKNESLESVSRAWKEETGSYPSDWVKNNNIYNQTGDVHYKYADYHYMPPKLINASLNAKYNDIDFSTGEKDVYLIEHAKISKQADDNEAVKMYEKKLVDLIGRTYGSKFLNLLEININNYKPGLGQEEFMKQKYHC